MKKKASRQAVKAAPAPRKKTPQRRLVLKAAPPEAMSPDEVTHLEGGGHALPGFFAFFEALAGTRLLTAASMAVLFDGARDRDHGALGCWAYPFARPDGGTTSLVERPGSFGNVRLFTAFFPEEKRAIVAWTGDGVEIGRPRKDKGIGRELARVALE